MGERLLCKQEVIGSIPFTSTNSLVDAHSDFGHVARSPGWGTRYGNASYLEIWKIRDIQFERVG